MASDVSTGWGGVSLFLPLAKFVLPFLLLLPQKHKMNKNNILGYVAAWLLFMQLYEVWYWVAPTPHAADIEAGRLAAELHIPIVEFLISLGFIGAFGLVVSKALSKASLIPVNAPFVGDSIGHHHHGVRPPEPKEIKIS